MRQSKYSTELDFPKNWEILTRAERYRYYSSKTGPKRYIEKREEILVKNKLYRESNRDSVIKQKREYYIQNKDAIRAHNNAYAEKNKEKLAARAKEWVENNKEYRAAYQKQYRAANKDKIAISKYAWERNELVENPAFKALTYLRVRMRLALKAALANKSAGTKQLLGCTPEQLKAHIEAQFQHGMSWDNYGFYGWHIDHIKPCAAFDLTDPEQQKQCFHYTNLQPLWVKDNFLKRDNFQDDSSSCIPAKPATPIPCVAGKAF